MSRQPHPSEPPSITRGVVAVPTRLVVAVPADLPEAAITEIHHKLCAMGTIMTAAYSRCADKSAFPERLAQICDAALRAEFIDFRESLTTVVAPTSDARGSRAATDARRDQHGLRLVVGNATMRPRKRRAALL